MVSVVIAAHNEAAVIGRCLDALHRQAGGIPLDITVVANGCDDATVAVAHRCGVQVIELAQAGKAHALAAGDAVAVGFPRIYLDADIELPSNAVAETERLFAEDATVLAAAPRRRLVAVDCSLPVRGYIAINQRLPAFENSLFGRGMIALSEDGRARFDSFPPMIADDLFLDSLYTSSQKQQISSVEVRVAAPRRTGPLLRRLVRVRMGNTQLRKFAEGPSRVPQVRKADRLAWITAVVVPHPHLVPAGIVYGSITILAAILAKVSRRAAESWARDPTTRQPRSASSPTTREAS